MNSAEKQEATKAISMKILETVIEGKATDSDINNIFEVAFDQLLQTCPVKGGSSQKLIPRRAASAGPLGLSEIQKGIVKEVDRRAQLAEIERPENEKKKEEKNEKRLEEIENELCTNHEKWKKIFIDRVSNQLRDQIKHSLAYIIVLYMAFKLGVQEVDPTNKPALIALLLQAIVALAIQVQVTYSNTTLELYEPLEKEKNILLSKKLERQARRAEERAKRAAARAQMSRSHINKGRGNPRKSRRNNRYNTRKIRN